VEHPGAVLSEGGVSLFAAYVREDNRNKKERIMKMCTSFKEQFPKNHRPEITDLETFWEEDVFALFRNFADDLLKRFDLRFGIPVWSEKNGWKYRIGKSGVYLIRGIQIEKNGFIVDGIGVNDKADYHLLIEHVAEVYEQNKCAFQEKINEKNARQKERNRKRVNRERRELEARKNQIISGKYNVFHWPDKLDVQKLKQLYKLDAMGIQDEMLAEEIGLTLYLRCKYGKEDAERMDNHIIRCHNCGSEIAGEDDFMQCGCGYQYSYREYRRSFRKNNMPTGAAAEIFAKYITDWRTARNYQEKMILIDTLLHEFHQSLISGARGRTVAMNFIDGTHEKVEAVINDLAIS